MVVTKFAETFSLEQSSGLSLWVICPPSLGSVRLCLICFCFMSLHGLRLAFSTEYESVAFLLRLALVPDSIVGVSLNAPHNHGPLTIHNLRVVLSSEVLLARHAF